MGGRGAYLKEQRNWRQVARSEELRVSLVSKKDPGASVALPLESITPNRIYATLGKDNELKQITVYNAKRQRVARIDFDHPHQGIKPYVQHGEWGEATRALNALERAFVRRVLKWLATLR